MQYPITTEEVIKVLTSLRIDCQETGGYGDIRPIVLDWVIQQIKNDPNQEIDVFKND